MSEEKLSHKSYDPGWNDPPLFSYESHEAFRQNSKGTKPLLNKRVSYTPDSVQSPNNVVNILCKDGPPKCAPVSMHKEDLPQTSISRPIDVSLGDVTTNLKHSVNELFKEDSQNNSQPVIKRIDLIEKLWNEGKFNAEIKEKLLKISQALKEGHCDEAEDIQRSLMVDYPSLCSSWMPGIRKLLHTMRDKENKNTTIS